MTTIDIDNLLTGKLNNQKLTLPVTKLELRNYLANIDIMRYNYKEGEHYAKGYIGNFTKLDDTVREWMFYNAKEKDGKCVILYHHRHNMESLHCKFWTKKHFVSVSADGLTMNSRLFRELGNSTEKVVFDGIEYKTKNRGIMTLTDTDARFDIEGKAVMEFEVKKYNKGKLSNSHGQLITSNHAIKYQTIGMAHEDAGDVKVGVSFYCQHSMKGNVRLADMDVTELYVVIARKDADTGHLSYEEKTFDLHNKKRKPLGVIRELGKKFGVVKMADMGNNYPFEFLKEMGWLDIEVDVDEYFPLAF